MGMGLAFTEIKREHQAVLRSWIAELSGEQAPEPAASATETEPEAGAIEANANMRLVLNELINLLVRKKIITENEGAAIVAPDVSLKLSTFRANFALNLNFRDAPEEADGYRSLASMPRLAITWRVQPCPLSAAIGFCEYL